VRVTVLVGRVDHDVAMGKNNRLRRAAKQRKQQRAEPRRTEPQPAQANERPRAAGAPLPPDPDPFTVAADAIRDARWEHHRGVPVGECVRPLLALPDVTIDRSVDEVFARLLPGMFAGGWSPIDLSELSSRRTDAAGSRYLNDAVAAVTADYPDHLVDPRWIAQIDQNEGRLWWDRRRPQLGQWSARHGQPRRDALIMVLQLFAM
jgi:hypothetical protein